MTKNDFLRLLQHPAELAGADFSELERIAARYPYSANAQLLLALAAELSAHPDRERHLRRAATVTFDRAHLFDTLRDLTAGGAADSDADDELENFSLEDLVAPRAEALPAGVATHAASQPRERYLPDPDPEGDRAPTPPAADQTTTEPEAPPPTEPPSSTGESAPATADAVETPPPHPPGEGAPADAEGNTNVEDYSPPATPQDPADFQTRSPISSKEELRLRLASIRRRQIAEAADQKRSVKKIARRSLIASDGIISATLAEVFIKQGQYQHAIRIYEQLALANPEKRPIFAALIKDLKR